MTARPEFRLVSLARLRAHEQYDERNVVELVADIRSRGVFADPIWVARGSFAVLNGHHRVEALRRLGARRIPAWVIDYESELVRLEPWRPGTAVEKSEVVRRARSGELYPPKTTRHRLMIELPARPVPLAELFTAEHPPVAHRAGRGRSRRALKDPADSG